jgi:hypothetical protein
VADWVRYYAIVGAGRTAQTPSGLARRRAAGTGPVDEALRRDFTWKPDSAIVEWEYGDLGAELVKITEDDAARLRDAFRVRWGALGPS